MVEVALGLGGVVLGAGLAWLLARAHFGAAALAASQELRARLAGLESRDKELQGQLTEHQLEVGELRTALTEARTDRARAEERWAAERRNLEEQRRLLDEAREQLTATFKALSAEALTQNQGLFLERARETLDAQLGPLEEALKRTDAHVRDLERARQEAYGTLEERLRSLAEQSRELQREAGNLASALRSSPARGRWGEIALRRIVELSGMTEHCDFTEQVSVEGEGGRVRPDMVVHLPGGRDIVIDVKVPLDAYDDAIKATTEEERRRALARHAQQVRLHMTQLAGKAYGKQFGQSPDLVVMFIPGESFVGAAVEADGELLADAMARRVVIATPTTLFALLSAIHHGWKQEHATKNAEAIHTLGQELYERLATLGAHFRSVGSTLTRTVEAYNDAVGSIERRVLPAARRFRDLTGARDAIPALEPVDQEPRRLTAGELAEQLELDRGAADARRRAPPAPGDARGPGG